MKKRFYILFGILIILICTLVHNSTIKYVYVSPMVNTKTLPYISKAIKPIDKNLDDIMNQCKHEYNDMKYVYKNYYGSGFLKNNPIPNDLDASVGVFIGNYEYDGTNADKIALNIIQKIDTYHIYSHSSFLSNKNPAYIMDSALMTKFAQLQNKEKESTNNISKGIKNVFSNKNNVIHSEKLYKEEKINYSLVMNDNEIFVNNLPPVFTYTKNISYNKDTKDFPRELTIIPDFFVTIKNTKTGKIKNIDLIEESFLGERFQISRRFFVPIIFTGNESLNYLKNLDYLNNDENYIQTRIFNYFRYIDEIKLYLDATIAPVKLLKRLHQCTDIISPVLTEEEQNKIYSDINKTLSNPDIKLANDYLTIIKNMSSFTSNNFAFYNAVKTGYLTDLLKESNSILNELSKNKKYNSEIKDLRNYQYDIETHIRKIDPHKSLNYLNKFFDDIYIKSSISTAKIINKNIDNPQEYIKDFDTLNNIFIKSGYHSMKLYWLDNKNALIEYNDFTKTLSNSDIKAIVKEYNLPEGNYKVVSKNKIKKGSKEVTLYVRYKSTDAENKYWQTVQDKLLKDKKNFKIKRKYL